ncbi:MAG: hypothetical protein K8953_05715, partial [Proteobacteria bacterium]|nr:hypothetical protein [Pseudomonadota bacterium]
MIEKNNIRIKTIEDFVTKVKRKHQAGISTEHSYRSSLENLLTIFGGSTIYPINEAKRIKYGAPDITLMQNKGMP